MATKRDQHLLSLISAAVAPVVVWFKSEGVDISVCDRILLSCAAAVAAYAVARIIFLLQSRDQAP